MSNTKFTPGPWVAQTDLAIGAAVYSNDGFKVAHIDGAVTAIDEDYANAHLIAAAPELYEALEALIQLKNWKDKHGKDEHYQSWQPGAWEAAKAALKKAQGGTE